MRARAGKTYALTVMMTHQKIMTGNTLTNGEHRTHYAKDFELKRLIIDHNRRKI